MVANPLRDLVGDAAYLAEFLRTVTGPIVLVGHSYGGNAAYMDARQSGSTSEEASAAAVGYMVDVKHVVVPPG